MCFDKLILLILFIIIIIKLIKRNPILETYVDPYSIELHTQAINRTKTWNYLHSNRYNNINWKGSKPNYKECYYYDE